MPRSRPSPDAYRKAQIAARQKAVKYSRQSLALVERELRLYADELAARLSRLRFSDRTSAARLAQVMHSSSRIITSVADRLQRRLVSGVSELRTLTFVEVQAIWIEAAERAAVEAGIIGVPMGAVVSPPLTLLGAYEALGGAGRTFRTILPELIQAGAHEVDAILRAVLIRGVGPDKLARRLRPYVQGIKEFHEAIASLPGIDPTDLRPLVQQALHDPQARHALKVSKVMRNNAQRIAFSEVYNARAEAEVQHYAADPMIDATLWRLAPDRGTGHTDECDALAMTDFFGMGTGAYPVNQVPYPPHPWCRCERKPRMRPFRQIGRPKPLPGRVLMGARARLPRGVTMDDAERIRARVESHLLKTALNGPQGQLTMLAQASIAV